MLLTIVADRGERCIAHCLVSFQEGDTELADCASKVTEMLAICGGFSYLVAANSSYNKDYAAVCKQVCEDCATECRKHDQHYECKDCAEACEKLVKKDRQGLRLTAPAEAFLREAQAIRKNGYPTGSRFFFEPLIHHPHLRPERPGHLHN